MDGIINVYKEKGFTSHDVVAVVRKIVNQKKVGHTGTLDPEAEGVLPICLGKATKLADYIMAESKTYSAEVIFGATTTTQDHTGEIVENRPFEFDKEKIKQAVSKFKGEILQVPPMYSAIKVNGKKLYEIARAGGKVERKARKIYINNIQIDEFIPPDMIKITVECPKGTYIRTLCHDIGEELGWGAYMSGLLRSRSGGFTLDTAVKLEKLKELCGNGRISEVILPMEEALKGYKKISVTKKADKFIHNGCKIYEYFFDRTDGKVEIGDIVAAYDSENNLVGLFTAVFDDEKNMVCIKPLKIL